MSRTIGKILVCVGPSSAYRDNPYLADDLGLELFGLDRDVALGRFYRKLPLDPDHTYWWAPVEGGARVLSEPPEELSMVLDYNWPPRVGGGFQTREGVSL